MIVIGSIVLWVGIGIVMGEVRGERDYLNLLGGCLVLGLGLGLALAALLDRIEFFVRGEKPKSMFNLEAHVALR